MPIIACAGNDLPAVKTDFCNPNVNFGQISEIFLGNIGNPFTDVTDLAEWTARIDNADVADATKVRQLFVVGDKPAPETNKLDISGGRAVYTEKNHTINFRIDETNDENYAFIKWLEANAGQQVLCWYAAGKYLYGGDEGITVSINLDDVIPESDEELNVFQGTITFEGGHPDRDLNPMA